MCKQTHTYRNQNQLFVPSIKSTSFIQVVDKIQQNEYSYSNNRVTIIGPWLKQTLIHLFVIHTPIIYCALGIPVDEGKQARWNHTPIWLKHIRCWDSVLLKGPPAPSLP